MSSLPHRYFAYGSNLSESQMNERCPGCEPDRLATLVDYRFRINARGVATVTPEAGSVVHGLLWNLNDDHVASLDGFEGIDAGRYTREIHTVDVDDGQVDTIIYIATNDVPGPARDGYLERVVGGARAFDLPEPYVRELASWFEFDANPRRQA